MSQKLKEQLSESFELIRSFNGCCGNDGKVPREKVLEVIENQAERVLEEIQEFIDAIKANDRQEILDGASDVIVTVDGLTMLVQKLIGDVGGATLAVCENNDLKYTGDKAVAEEWLEHYQTNYDPASIEETYYLKESEFDGGVWYCVRRTSDNKIMKPPRHPKVDLKPFLYRDDC